jgi:hypothetical protein
MAAGWSNYQVTQGYLSWFYYVKFAVVSLIALGFACFSIFRIIDALRPPAPRKPAARRASEGAPGSEPGNSLR